MRSRKETPTHVPLFAAVGVLFCLGLMLSSCSTEDIDNFNSRVACRHYCDKAFDCLGADPTDGEYLDCVTDCRNSIEKDCGNVHQRAANDQIEECVDRDSCGEFWLCMVFEAAPECFGFVNPPQE